MSDDLKPVQIRRIIDGCTLSHQKDMLTDTDMAVFEEVLRQTWKGKSAWVLGHMTDGVVWGKIEDGRIVCANDADTSFGPPLNFERLLDLRVFSPHLELRIWRYDGQVKSCLVREDASKGRCRCYDEHQILISARRTGQKTASGVTFSRLRGPGGQTHAVPVDWDGKRQAWRLKVRHYLGANETGMLNVIDSRFLDICQKS